MESGAPARTTAVGTAVALALLLVAAARPGAAVGTLRTAGTGEAGSNADLLAPVLAVVSLLAWALAGWLLLTVLLTLVTRAPGGAGRLGGALARQVAPAAVRRMIEVALGLTVTAGVLGSGPAVAAPDSPRPGPTGSSLSLDWPGATAPSLDWPATADGAGAPTSAPGPADAPEASGAAAPDAAPEDNAAQDNAAEDAVVVRPGDSLWGLAADDLERRTGTEPTVAQTAKSWPHWWAANREAVGTDPDLLHPGTALARPSDLPSDRGSDTSPDA